MRLKIQAVKWESFGGILSTIWEPPVKGPLTAYTWRRNDDASLPAGGGNMIYALEIFTKNKSHSLSFTSSLSLR